MINGLDADWARSYTLAEHRWGLTNVVRRSYMIRLQDPADGPDGEWKDVPCLPPLQAGKGCVRRLLGRA